MFDFVSKILEGPPSVPAGSTVSVGRSKLEIDCGDGYPADAEQRHRRSATITGNLFACDGCSLGADRMHAAVAKLFVGDPENVEAVQALAQGWITDWFRTDPATPLVGIYSDPTQPGTIVTIPTDTGADAHAYVLPAPPAQLSIIDVIVEAALDATPNLVVAPCAADPSDMLSEYTAEVFTENSTQNAALSLDGRSQTGQSVGQHVCTG